MSPPRSATAWRSSATPAGSTGTTQRALMRILSVMQMKSPAGAGLVSGASDSLPRTRRLRARRAEHLDFHAAVRLQALDQRLARLVLRVRAALDLQRLAEAEGLDPVRRRPLPSQVGFHRLGAALRELLVVLR